MQTKIGRSTCSIQQKEMEAKALAQRVQSNKKEMEAKALAVRHLLDLDNSHPSSRDTSTLPCLECRPPGPKTTLQDAEHNDEWGARIGLSSSSSLPKKSASNRSSHPERTAASGHHLVDFSKKRTPGLLSWVTTSPDHAHCHSSALGRGATP